MDVLYVVIGFGIRKPCDKMIFFFQGAAEDLTALLTDGNMRLRPISRLMTPLFPSII